MGTQDPAAASLPDIPDSLRVVEVFNDSQLRSALANAQPGDHIVLADGLYPGFYELSRKGTETDPIVLTSESRLGALLSARLTLSGSHLIVKGLDFKPANLVINRASHIRVTRSRFHGTDGWFIAADHSSDVLIDQSEFSAEKGITSGSLIGIQMRATNRNFEIAYNYFHTFSWKTSNYYDLATAAINTGFTVDGFKIETAHHIHHNLFMHTGSAEIEIKSSGNIIEYNTIIGEEGSHPNSANHIRIEGGGGNIVRGNWVESAYGIEVAGEGNQLICNYSSSWIRIKAGMSSDITKNPGLNTILVGNTGPLLVGHFYGSADSRTDQPANGTIIQRHSGEIRHGRETNTTILEEGAACDPPEKLEVWDVGPYARTFDPTATFEVTVPATETAVIYEEAEKAYTFGDLHVGRFSGPDGMDQRTLLQFDLPASLPGNARIQHASIGLVTKLTGSSSFEESFEINLHRLSNSWSEGDLPGSSTWLHRHYPDQFWSSPGGDFFTELSASVSIPVTIGSMEEMTVSGSRLADDVQSWLADPQSNFGWILKVDESASSGTTVAFNSRFARSAWSHPRLTIRFSLEPMPQWGSWQASNLDGDYEDTNGLGWINIRTAPWVYSYTFERWLYLPEPSPQSGYWIYFPRL